MDCYSRMDVDVLKDTPVNDMTPTELIVFLRKKYPGDSRGALQYMHEHQQIGNVLYNSVKLILEGIK